jgi:multiple sugar transport system substrate-binding protein
MLSRFCSTQLLFGAVTALTLGIFGCSGGPSTADAGPQQITIYSFGETQVLHDVEVAARSFEAKTGIKVTVVGDPIGNLMTKAKSEAASSSSSYDVLVFLNVWMGDLVNLGYINPLDSYITRDMSDTELAWSDVIDGVKRKNVWGGHTYGMIVDNDNFQLFYRKDILNPSSPFNAAWKLDATNNPTGKDLGAPQTIDEVIGISKFFVGKDWDVTVTDKTPFVTAIPPGVLSAWYGINWAAPYTVVPRASAPAPGVLFFNPTDMTPLVNNEGFVRGMQKYAELVKCCTPALVGKVADDTGMTAKNPDHGGDNGAIARFVHGKALMAIGWGDIGPASVRADSVVKGKVGFTLSPGTNDYFDWTASPPKWVHTADVHRVPMHEANGWSLFMTSTSKNKDAAWRFMKYMGSPDVSVATVTDPVGGYQPWRSSALVTAPWEAAGWGATDAKAYVQTILDTTNHPDAVIDIRIPGTFDYYGAFDTARVSILDGADAKTAMDKAAADMKAVTAANPGQLQNYRSHLGL